MFKMIFKHCDTLQHSTYLVFTGPFCIVWDKTSALNASVKTKGGGDEDTKWCFVWLSLEQQPLTSTSAAAESESERINVMLTIDDDDYSRPQKSNVICSLKVKQHLSCGGQGTR